MFNITCGVIVVAVGWTFNTWQSWVCVVVGGLLVGWNYGKQKHN